jgi:hypothetical protein
MRKVKDYSKDGRQAVVFRNAEYDEYVVKFYIDGVYQANADYHADSKDDAVGTAKAFCNI